MQGSLFAFLACINHWHCLLSPVHAHNVLLKQKGPYHPVLADSLKVSFSFNAQLLLWIHAFFILGAFLSFLKTQLSF